MSDVIGVAGDWIRSFVKRIEQIESELKELTKATKEIFSEAKGEVLDVKILNWKRDVYSAGTIVVRRCCNRHRSASAENPARFIQLRRFWACRCQPFVKLLGLGSLCRLEAVLVRKGTDA